MSVAIFGTRVVLRDFMERDIEPFMAWQRPHHTWYKTNGPYYPLPTTDQVSTMESRLREAVASSDWPMPRDRMVIADGDTDHVIGVVTWYWESEETNWLSVGVAIFDPAMWGKGIGYEALGLWSQYLFDSMPEIVRLDLRTYSGNLGMMRLAEKLGYLEEARFRKARIVNGEYYDGMGYGVLREEWEAHYPDGFASHLP